MLNGRSRHEPDPSDESASGPSDGLTFDDDVTFPDDELRAAFAPAGPGRKTTARPSVGPRGDAGQASILSAAERYAAQFREQPRYHRQWAESAPPPVRALFLAIRANTLGDQVRDPDAGPYRYDPTLPRLGDLSQDLQDLLRTSWPVWDEPQP